MVEIPEKKIIEKGRLGPGQLIAVNLKKGKIYKDKEIKAVSYTHLTLPTICSV